MVYDDANFKKQLEEVLKHLMEVYKGRLTIRMFFNLLLKYWALGPR